MPAAEQELMRFFREWKDRRISKIIGNDEFIRLRGFSWTVAFLCLAIPGLVLYSRRYAHCVGDFFRWFVRILELPVVMKLPLLEDPAFYFWISVGVYAYLAAAVFWDLGKWFGTVARKELVLTGKECFVIDRRIIGYRLHRWQKSRQDCRIELRSGFLRRIFAMEKIYFHFPDESVSSPYFSRWIGDNSLVVYRLL